MVYKIGQQIAYVPTHAQGDVNHPDVEFGFVTSQKGARVWCRFYRNPSTTDLRTKLNSEPCSARDLKEHILHNSSIIERKLRELGYLE